MQFETYHTVSFTEPSVVERFSDFSPGCLLTPLLEEKKVAL